MRFRLLLPDLETKPWVVNYSVVNDKGYLGDDNHSSNTIKGFSNPVDLYNSGV